MRQLAVLILLAAVLAAPQALLADTLEDPHGAKVEGTLEEITFRTNEMPSVLPRDLLRSVEVREEGNDLVGLASGEKREGRLVTVRFKSPEGIVTMTRAKVKTITLGEGQAPTESTPKAETKPDSEAAAEGNEDQKAVEKDNVSAEDLARRELLGQNQALARAAFDKADQLREEEVKKLKDKYLRDADKVVKDVDRLEETIKDKLKRRREAEERWNYLREHSSVGDHNRYNRPPDFSNDGLEKDMRDYRNAKERRNEIRDTINAEMDKIDRRRAIRKQRVRVGYELLKKQITEGQAATEEQMKEKYFAALDLERKDGKKAGDAAVALDGKRKDNPFDEMFKDKTRDAKANKRDAEREEKKAKREAGDLKAKEGSGEEPKPPKRDKPVADPKPEKPAAEEKPDRVEKKPEAPEKPAPPSPAKNEFESEFE
jgi:hypothetical protein